MLRSELVRTGEPPGVYIPTAVVAFSALAQRYLDQDEVFITVCNESGLERHRFAVKSDTGFSSARSTVEAELRFCSGQNVWKIGCEGLGAGLPGAHGSMASLPAEIFLIAEPGNEGQVRLSYYDEHLTPAFVSTLAGQMAVFLDHARGEPNQKLSLIRVSTQTEVEDLISNWIGPKQDYSPLTISETLEQTAHRFPDRIALIHQEQRLTLAQLNSRSNRLARFLQRFPDAGCRIGIWLPNSIDAIVSIIAILKAGAAYVPLDPSHPPGRLAEIAQDAEVRVIIADSVSAGAIRDSGATVIKLDQLEQALLTLASDDFRSGASPESPAYVLYTSGSTGRPIGVVGIHRSITNGIAEAQFDVRRSDEVSCLNSPLSVGISLLPLFLPLLCGVPLVVFSPEEMIDPWVLAQAISRYGVTTIGLATPMLRTWVSLGEKIAPLLRKLRCVMTGGAPLTPDLVESFSAVFPWVTLENGYGSTELGSIATRGVVGPGRLSIGKPITNTTIYLLDRHLIPVPQGAVGEIYVSSQHLSPGYVNQPELMKQRFLTNPFAGRGESRMFRTGDLGRYSPSGIEFLGRRDDQCKIRGFRVHLAEVEAALADCSGIGAVAVAAKPLGAEMRLVAYYVEDAGKSVQPASLRGALRSRLPDYMIPSHLIKMQKMPLTQGGKLDRRALPEPSPFVESDAYDGAGNGGESPEEIEAFLVRAWRSGLRTLSVSRHDHFFDLGGDSLFAVSVNARIGEHFGIELTLEDFYKHPTISDLGALITLRLRRTSDQSADAAIL